VSAYPISFPISRGIDYPLGNPLLGGASANIQLSNASFLAGAAQGTAIGTLSVSGGKGTYVFTLTNNAALKAQVAGTNGVNLQAGSAAAGAGSFSVTVHADNGAGSVLNRTFLITATGTVFLAMDMSDFRNTYILGL
jgi:hypothetical protein